MTDHITPQEAQDLLDVATPGPWKAWGIMRHPGTPTYILGKEAEQVAGSPHTDEGGIATHNRDLIVAAPRLAATIAADTIEYGIHIEFPDREFMHPIHGHRGVWTTDKALVEHDVSGLRENVQLRDASIRVIARHISPTWEVKE